MDDKIIYVYGKKVGALRLVCYELSVNEIRTGISTCSSEIVERVVQMMMDEGYRPVLDQDARGKRRLLPKGVREGLEKLIKK